MIKGNNFYAEKPEEEFTKRVSSWLNYLEINDFFPNINELTDKLTEVGGNLRDAGDASFLGLNNKKTNALLFRPGDYSVLLHELTHNYDNALSSEAGAFAIEAFTCGDFEGTLDNLIGSKSYSSEDKRKGRVLSEASIVLGRNVFDYIKKHKILPDMVTLVNELKDLINSKEKSFLKSKKNEVDYLINFHGLTENVANYLLTITKDTKETIFTSTSNIKKEVIGAFKGLTSFYHINLGYTIEEAINKTEKHFMENEALTIHKTLYYGAKDVFAKLKEYGYELSFCRQISEAMIQQGPSKAIIYAKKIPNFLKLIGDYGPRGDELLSFAMSNQSFFDVMTLRLLTDDLLSVSETQPEQTMLLLSKLVSYPWNFELNDKCFNSSIQCYLDQPQVGKLDSKTKAKIASLAVYIYLIDKDKLVDNTVKDVIEKHQKSLFVYSAISIADLFKDKCTGVINELESLLTKKLPYTNKPELKE